MIPNLRLCDSKHAYCESERIKHHVSRKTLFTTRYDGSLLVNMVLADRYNVAIPKDSYIRCLGSLGITNKQDGDVLLVIRIRIL